MRKRRRYSIEFKRQVIAADLLVAYEAKIAAWSGWSASRRWNSSS